MSITRGQLDLLRKANSKVPNGDITKLIEDWENELHLAEMKKEKGAKEVVFKHWVYDDKGAKVPKETKVVAIILSKAFCLNRNPVGKGYNITHLNTLLIVGMSGKSKALLLNYFKALSKLDWFNEFDEVMASWKEGDEKPQLFERFREFSRRYI